MAGTAERAPDAGRLPRPMRVARRWRETHDTWTLQVAPADGTALPGLAPGQFNMLYAFGVGEIPVSVSATAARGAAWLHTIRAVGPASRALAGLRAGEALGLRGPFGTPWPLPAAAGGDVVLVAGGLGLAPLRPALEALLADRSRYGRIALLYGTRSVADVLFGAELEAWRRRADLEVELTVDHAAAGWHGNVGVVTNLVRRARFDPDRTLAMVCGPELMMRFSVAALTAAGVPADRVYLSMERNMKCAVGHCGHCQFGPSFVCRDGPVLASHRVNRLLACPEI